MKTATLLVGLALVATPALAQTGSQTGAAPHTAATGSTAATAHWMTQPPSSDWLVSHLKGVDVYNGDNRKLGSIDELIMDRQGKVQAAILDVGGFLGMGVHRVAIPFEQLRFEDRAGARTAGNAATPITHPAVNSTTNNAPGNPTAVGPANTGVGNTTATNGANTATTDAARTGTANDRHDNIPERATLNMTADQLKAAPEFRYHA